MKRPPSRTYGSEVPARIRDIVTSSLEEDKEEAASLIAENENLQSELSKVEERLSSIRADRQSYSLNSYLNKTKVHFFIFFNVIH